MDIITQSYLNDFLKTNEIEGEDLTRNFEDFCNYSIVSTHHQENFDIQDISVGDAQGIDGIAILVNGDLVNSQEEVDDLISTNRYLDVTFIFTQVKTSSGFDAGNLLTFLTAVKDFFSSSPLLPQNELVREKSSLTKHIFKNSIRMTNGRPNCLLYFVTTGSWGAPPQLVGLIEKHRSELLDFNLFSSVLFYPIGASEIQDMYINTTRGIKTEIVFSRHVTLPQIEGVEQSFIGILPVSEYMKLITDENGEIRRSVFHDNVRDYQGDVGVNKQIEDTLNSHDAGRFLILNNGVTIISEGIKQVADKFTLEGYQVVNGCQTSHVIYNVMIGKQQSETDNVYVPIKLISSTDGEVVSQIIRSTNSQTGIKPEQFTALTPFARELEKFYAAFEGPNRLYYERRSGQYARQLDIQKVRIVSVATQIKVLESMFLDRPYQAWGHSGKLVREASKSLFKDDDSPLPYYISALANYQLEYMFRNKWFEPQNRRFRFHILMVLRYLVDNQNTVSLQRNKKSEQYYQKYLNVLNTTDKSYTLFNEAIALIQELLSEETEPKDIEKSQAFTERIKNYFK